MAFPSKIKLPTAVTSRSTLKYDCQHITTSDFMEFQCAYAKELVPDQKYKVKHESFSRLEPLVKPTFGRAEFQHRVFWVPFRTVFPGWNDFITDTPHVYNNSLSSIIPNVPIITNATFCEFLMLSPLSEITPGANASYDFVIYNGGTSAYEYRKLTSLGRFAYKNLRALGYAPYLDTRINYTWSSLPLLCLMRVFSDWYYPAQYANTEMMNIFTTLFTVNNEPSSSVSHIVANQLMLIFRCMSVLAHYLQ